MVLSGAGLDHLALVLGWRGQPAQLTGEHYGLTLTAPAEPARLSQEQLALVALRERVALGPGPGGVMAALGRELLLREELEALLGARLADSVDGALHVIDEMRDELHRQSAAYPGNTLAEVALYLPWRRLRAGVGRGPRREAQALAACGVAEPVAVVRRHARPLADGWPVPKECRPRARRPAPGQ